MKYQRLFLLFFFSLGFLISSCESDSDTTKPNPKPIVPDPPALTAEPDDESKSLFDSDEVRTFELVVSPENLEILDSDPVAEEYVSATLKFEGEVIL